MSFVSHDPGGRYRKRAAENRRKAFHFLLIISIVSYVSYWIGKENVKSHEAACQQQAQALKTRAEEMEKTITDLRAEAQSTQLRYSQMEEKYKTDVPQGDFKKVTDIVRRRMDAGVKADRLIASLDSTRPPKNRSDPQVKRFIMKTPVYSGPHGQVTFANGAVTVSGEGAPAVGQTGKEEAWYDPGKPASLTFTAAGKMTKKEGLLPIEYSVVLGNKEHRFTVAPGPRSFINVTSDTCNYP